MVSVDLEQTVGALSTGVSAALGQVGLEVSCYCGVGDLHGGKEAVDRV